MKKRSSKSNKKMVETVLVLIFGLALLIYVLKTGAEIAIPYTNDELLEKYASENHLEKGLVAAVIYQESGYQADAISDRGAIGLMQIMPDTGEWIAEKLNETFSEDRLLDPETNVRYGTWYLKFLYDKYDNIQTALAAYNAGPTNVDGWLEDPDLFDGENLVHIPFAETKNYVETILRMKDVYEKMYADKFTESEQ